MAELSWTEEAQSSLQDIYDHIARDRPATAQRTLESIIDRAQSLREYPALGQVYAYDPEVRILSHGHFQLAYRIASKQRIDVLGVFNGLIFLPLK